MLGIIPEKQIQDLMILASEMESLLGLPNRISKASEETAELSAAISKLNASVLETEKNVARSRIIKELCDSIFTLIPVIIHLSESYNLKDLISYNLDEVLFKNRTLINKLKATK